MELLCGRVCTLILVIILIIAAIVTCQEGSKNVFIFLVFWWGHFWEFHWVSVVGLLLVVPLGVMVGAALL